MKKLSIAIDGPAAAGKSTIAKLIAEKYQYVYIDTGAMYRSVAFNCLSKGIDLNDEKAVCETLNDFNLVLTNDAQVILNDVNVSLDIRTNEVSKAASIVSKYGPVRACLVDLQRKMANAGGVVLDGRDIGTVVLPNADLKIYQIASVEARALRRHIQNQKNNLPSDLEEIKKDIEMRDYQDMNREISPLKKADDAIEIDTSDMTIEEVTEKISSLIDEKINEVSSC